MKKVFAILISSIMLVSALQVSIDRHFCGGELADIKLSVTGSRAFCEMNTDASACAHQNSIDKKCCEDQLTSYSLISNYVPECFNLLHSLCGKVIQAVPVHNDLFTTPEVADLKPWALPPGKELKPAVSLAEIRVFRI